MQMLPSQPNAGIPLQPALQQQQANQLMGKYFEMAKKAQTTAGLAQARGAQAGVATAQQSQIRGAIAGREAMMAAQPITGYLGR